MTDDPRPVLLGMNNPLSLSPDYALWPAPTGCTGWRLWRLVQEGVGCYVSEEDYAEIFDRRNLLPRRKTWSDRLAREAAVELIPRMRTRSVVVLGARTWRALGLPPAAAQPGDWLVQAGAAWCPLPHPSGRNRWYNDPACRAVAAAVLAELYLAGRAAPQ